MSETPDDPMRLEQEPLDPEQSERQIHCLLGVLGPAPQRILDLGSGAGRVLIPLAQAGHEVVGLDQNGAMLDMCRAALDAARCDAALIEADFTDGAALPDGPFDAVLCLGNTLMTIWDVDQALALCAAARDRLAPGGAVYIDDIPGLHWCEVAEGYWGPGVSEDGMSQFIWAERDVVFTLRTGDAVDHESWVIAPENRKYRIWTDGSLQLLARAARLSPLATHAEGHLIVMRRLEDTHER